MMGPVLYVEVDSSETEDRVHQADVNLNQAGINLNLIRFNKFKLKSGGHAFKLNFIQLI